MKYYFRTDFPEMWIPRLVDCGFMRLSTFSHPGRCYIVLTSDGGVWRRSTKPEPTPGWTEVPLTKLHNLAKTINRIRSR